MNKLSVAAQNKHNSSLKKVEIIKVPADVQDRIDRLTGEIGNKEKIVIKNFLIGTELPLKASVVYVEGLADRDIISRDILKPLMTEVKEELVSIKNIGAYLSDRYIYVTKSYEETDVKNAASDVKNGKTALIISGTNYFLMLDTSIVVLKDSSEPLNEVSLRGIKSGFTDSLDNNISIIRTLIKDKNLKTDTLKLGVRSQTNTAVVYIDDIVDKDILNDIKNRLNKINIDSVQGIGEVEQLIQKYTYTIFPQTLITERPDRTVGNIMEGRIAVLLDGTPFLMIVPVMISDFFQAVEDYFQRFFLSSFIRILRLMAVIMVISLPSLYLIFVRFNSELISLKLLIPIIQSRKGIPIPPLLEILSMEIVIEFLREGGLRLPSKIGQTLSVVGGFIIGDAAIRARIVSPATLVVVGIAAIGTFVIPNYEMALAIRFVRFPILILSNFLGVLGYVAGIYALMVHLYSLDSFGVPYCYFNKYSDYKDIFIRAPIEVMNKRPEGIPNNNPVRQNDKN